MKASGWNFGKYALLIAMAVLAYSRYFGERITTTSLSPDDTIRAELIDYSPRWIDRNFRVRLFDLKTDRKITIFKSPDEGMPEGSERFLWSKDGTTVLLVGRHFSALQSGLFLDTGERPYFLYHVKARRGWCNSKQQSAYPPMTEDLLKSIEFEQTFRIERRGGREEN